MAGFIREIEIARPIADVFALLSEPDRMPAWQPGVWKCECLGPRGMGRNARLDVMSGPRGRSRVRRNLVSVYAPPRLLSLTANRFGIISTHAWRLNPRGPDATHVALSVSARGQWWMAPLIARAIEASDGTMLVWLKTAAERDV